MFVVYVNHCLSEQEAHHTWDTTHCSRTKHWTWWLLTQKQKTKRGTIFFYSEQKTDVEDFFTKKQTTHFFGCIGGLFELRNRKQNLESTVLVDSESGNRPWKLASFTYLLHTDTHHMQMYMQIVWL
jgi:hypothetical protein